MNIFFKYNIKDIKLKDLKNLYYLPILVGILLFIFWDVLTSERTVSPDAYLILPYLESITHLKNYFVDLIELKGFDIQPIRDLSLWIDLWIFKKIGLNIFIWHNLLLFLGSILAWRKIIKLESGSLNKNYLIVIILLIATYPVYSHIISYSMARKHLLSLFFISISTLYFLKGAQEKNWSSKNQLGIIIAYILSIFSQPISLLFPMWTILYTFVKKIPLSKSNIRLHLILFIFFIFGFILNYVYYENSPVMTSIFGSKTNNAFDIEGKIYSFFTYFYNLFFPFQLSFYSSLQLRRPFFGLAFIIFFSFIYLYYVKDLKKYLIWIGFTIFPILIITTSPYQIYYTYLTIPVMGIFVLVFDLIEKSKHYFTNILLLLMIISSSYFSKTESKKWTNEKDWGYLNISRDAHCNSVSRYARGLLSEGEIPPENILHFLRVNQCSSFSTDYNQIELIVFETQLLFYKKDLPLETKIKSLKKYGEINFYPLLILSMVYLEENRFNEAREMIDETIKFLGGARLGTMYDKILADKLIPFCQRINHQECLNRFSSLTVRGDYPYF